MITLNRALAVALVVLCSAPSVAGAPQSPGSAIVADSETTIITDKEATIPDNARVVVIQQTSETTLRLPSVKMRRGIPLHIVDWSSLSTERAIILNPAGNEKIMRRSPYVIYSNATQLGSLTLYPSIALDGWFVAP